MCPPLMIGFLWPRSLCVHQCGSWDGWLVGQTQVQRRKWRKRRSKLSFFLAHSLFLRVVISHFRVGQLELGKDFGTDFLLGAKKGGWRGILKPLWSHIRSMTPRSLSMDANRPCPRNEKCEKWPKWTVCHHLLSSSWFWMCFLREDEFGEGSWISLEKRDFHLSTFSLEFLLSSLWAPIDLFCSESRQKYAWFKTGEATLNKLLESRERAYYILIVWWLILWERYFLSAESLLNIVILRICCYPDSSHSFTEYSIHETYKALRITNAFKVKITLVDKQEDPG